MKKYYLYSLFLCLFTFEVFAQRPKAVTDFKSRSGGFPIGVQIINTGQELVFSAYDSKKGNQLFIYDGLSTERVSRFSDSYKNGRFEPEQQSKIPLGAVSSGFIPYDQSVVFTAMGDLTKPSVYRYSNGGVDKLKTNLTTSEIHCRLKDDLYFIGSKLVTNEEEKTTSWEKGVYKAENGEHIHHIKKLSDLAPKINDLAEANGKIYFITSKNFYSFDGEDYTKELSFEKEELHSIVVIGGEVFIWAYKGRKKSLIETVKGRTLTSRLVKNRDRIGATPHDLLKNGTLAYTEDAYSRQYDVVLAQAKNFKDGAFPGGIFQGRAKVDHIESYAWFEDLLLVCMKERGKNEYNLWQYGNDTLIKYRFRRIKDIRSIQFLKGKLYFTASGSSGRQLYEYIPFKAPELRDQSFSMMEMASEKTSVGRVKVDKLNGKTANFKIVEGNTNDAFSIDTYTGLITVKTPSEIRYRKNPVFNLVVEVDNRHMTSTCKAKITLQESKSLNRRNLQERFLFFPDFAQKGVLKTTVIANGETIEIYNLQLRMIDKTVVENGQIRLGNYPPGIYYLNANNGKRNFVQKMEMN